MNKQFVLDTSLFVNPASASAFGSSPTEAFSNFLNLAKKVSSVSFFMPPSIYRELMHFAEEKKINPALLSAVEQKSPKKHEILVPGFFIYQLVETFRDRVDRGLRLAERHVREAFAAPPVAAGPGRQYPKGTPDQIRADADAISSLRESFRRMMREGMLDSKADVDLLLLAYETKGALVSADEGVLLWAENLGIEILPYERLLPTLQEKAAEKTP